MRHTDAELEAAAARFEHLADELDPETMAAVDASDLRKVAIAADAIHTDKARLRDAVEAARAAGRSWNQIAVALGVSRQAARQRFDKANA